jgi:hypothetical protein
VAIGEKAGFPALVVLVPFVAASLFAGVPYFRKKMTVAQTYGWMSIALVAWIFCVIILNISN